MSESVDELTQKFSDLWQKFVNSKDDGSMLAAISDWDGATNAKVWEGVRDLRTRRSMRIMSENKPEAKKELDAWLAAMEELFRVREQLRLVHTTDTSDAGAVGAAVREHAAATIDSNRLPLVNKYANKEVRLSAKVTKLTNQATAGLGVSAARGDVLVGLAGKGCKVDHIDEALVEMLRDRVAIGLRASGITPYGGVAKGDVSRSAVINAALTMVIRAGGVTGLQLNEPGELLLELLGSQGDLARTVSIDARLAVLGESMNKVLRQSERTHTTVSDTAKSVWGTALTASYLLAERVHALGVVNSNDVDIASGPALGFFERLTGQARRERNNRLAAAGRPSAAAAEQRKKGEAKKV